MKELVINSVPCIADSFLTSEIWIVIWTESEQYEVYRSAKDKPRALTCSGEEYLTQLHHAFHNRVSDFRITGHINGSTMEIILEEANVDIPIRFDSMTLHAVTVSNHILTVAQQWRMDYDKMSQSLTAAQDRVAKLEALVQEKDVMLDAAFSNKTQGEAQVIEKCVRLLNTKKEEITHLRQEIEQLQVANEEISRPAKRARTSQGNRRKPKVKKAVIETSSSEAASSEESAEDNNHSIADLASQAYSNAVPTSLRQFYSAERLLKEEEAEEVKQDDEHDFLDML
ncbi:hypothetical protein THRCLA_10617 [Thraustotheca clavata]|uniref:DNA repair protein XRCC4 n=1 Tax=Thraustotheca clavata TaxID=74557 RepID=A0A1V9YJJ8_9STRA|nr:hypothetical protein THRCLA_10617 [Thraustotheca clavata]